MTLHLVRHGVADGMAGRATGRTDVPLADAGRAAVEVLAAGWALARPARIVSSPLVRARASADVLGAAWGRPVEADARLAEVDFGAWDGRTWADLEATEPDALAAWMADWTTARPPGGESFADVQARVAGWLAEVAADGRETLAVAHAGPIRAAVAQVLGLPAARAFRLDVQHAALTTLRLEPPALVRLNATP